MSTIVQAGSVNVTAQVVPDLTVIIVPPTVALLNGVPTNVIGVVGSASWGPVDQVVPAGNYNEYASLFGPLVNRTFDMGTHVAIATQQGATSFLCVRVTDGTDVAATATGPAGCLTLTSICTGSLGNSTQFSIVKGSKSGTWAVVISLPGIGNEKFDNITGSGNAFWVAAAAAINTGTGSRTGASKLVVATAGSGTTAPSALGPYTLTGGTDGASGITSGALIGSSASPITGMYSLQNQQASILDLCDLTDTTQWSTADAFAQTWGMYNIVVGESGDTLTDAVSNKNTAGIDSYSTKVMFGDWIWWYDPANAIYRLVSPQAFAAGRLANLSPEQSSLNKSMASVVGSQKVGLPGSTTINQYSTADLTTIFTDGIDVITNPGAGNLPIWTCRLGHNSSSNATINGDNYTRMTNYIASTLKAGMGQYIGQVINLEYLSNVRATLLAFLRAMLDAGMLAPNLSDGSLPYTVVCDQTNNTQNQVALGYVTANVMVTYQGIAEKFNVYLEGGTSVVTSLASAGS
jgi:hypothetical protein